MKYTSDALDKVTGGLKTLTTDHAYIHEGRFFTADDLQTIATGATLAFGFIAPTYGNMRIHYRPAYITSSADKLTISFYKASTFTGGTALTANNHVIESARTAKFSVVRAPTISENGTLIQKSYIPGAAGVGQNRSGGFTSQENEWVLKPGEKYLGILTNGSTAENIVCLNFQWYEEGGLSSLG